jgi:hypothetical protein
MQELMVIRQFVKSSVSSIDLFSLITGEDTGGTWSRLTGTGGTFSAAAGTFVPTGATTSTFKYTFSNISMYCR